MTAQNQFTQFYTDCKVEQTEGSQIVTGSFRVQIDIPSSADELDQIIELADQIGQFVKQNVAATTLEQADRTAARLAQQLTPHLHKHGTRPFTFLMPFGRVAIRRTRLFDAKTRKTCIPSATPGRNRRRDDPGANRRGGRRIVRILHDGTPEKRSRKRNT